jgi:thiamine transporter ThiT
MEKTKKGAVSMKLSPVKKLVFTAACVALCVVLPLAFHTIPNAGTVFLPMHIPVLLCGLVCGWPYGLVTGLMGPMLSSIITGMPPAAMLPSMMVECGVYGLVTGLMMKYIRTGKLLPDLYISMLTAMALGRVVSGLAKALIFTPGTAPFAWVTTSLVAGIPGIVIQLVLMPLVIFALTRARLIPVRYLKGETV